MKNLGSETGLFDLLQSEITSINGGDSNGTMVGPPLSLDWTIPVINFVRGVFDGIFS